MVRLAVLLLCLRYGVVEEIEQTGLVLAILAVAGKLRGIGDAKIGGLGLKQKMRILLLSLGGGCER